MIICEYEFEQPDNDNPNYSLAEVDYYAWVPYDVDVAQHRLSLRKNLKTGKFEVYRRYQERTVIVRPEVIVETSKDAGYEEVMFYGTLGEAIKFADGEWRKYHGEKEDDEVCEHEYPKKAMMCEMR